MHVACLLAAALLSQGAGWAKDVKRIGQGASASEGTKDRGREPQRATPPASAALAIEESLQRIATAQETQARAEKSAEEKEHQKRDLAAQESMALWAKCMFWATAVTIVLSAATTVLVVLTFRQTLKATVAARRSAAASRQSVRVARQSAEKQLRAYVWQKTGADGISNFANGGFVLQCHIHNSGQSPAYFVHQWAKLDALAHDTREFESPPDNIPGPRFVVHPGGEHVFHTPTEPMTAQQRDEMVFGNKILFFWGQLNYIDAFDQPRSTRFRLYWKLYVGTPSGPLLGQWVFCDEGNDAT